MLSCCYFGLVGAFWIIDGWGKDFQNEKSFSDLFIGQCITLFMSYRTTNLCSRRTSELKCCSLCGKLIASNQSLEPTIEPPSTDHCSCFQSFSIYQFHQPSLVVDGVHTSNTSQSTPLYSLNRLLENSISLPVINRTNPSIETNEQAGENNFIHFIDDNIKETNHSRASKQKLKSRTRLSYHHRRHHKLSKTISTQSIQWESSDSLCLNRSYKTSKNNSVRVKTKLKDQCCYDSGKFDMQLMKENDNTLNYERQKPQFPREVENIVVLENIETGEKEENMMKKMWRKYEEKYKDCQEDEKDKSENYYKEMLNIQNKELLEIPGKKLQTVKNLLAKTKNKKNLSIKIQKFIDTTKIIIQFTENLDQSQEIATMITRLKNIQVKAQTLDGINMHDQSNTHAHLFHRLKELRSAITTKIGIELFRSFHNRFLHEFNQLINDSSINEDGFEDFVIDMLFPQIASNIDGECTICLQPILYNTKVRSLQCQHWFHSECIIKWLNNSKRCPMCRKQQNQNLSL